MIKRFNDGTCGMFVGPSPATGFHFTTGFNNVYTGHLTNSKLASLTYQPTTMIYTVWQRGTNIVVKNFFHSLGEAADWCVANGWELQSPAPIRVTPESTTYDN